MEDGHLWIAGGWLFPYPTAQPLTLSAILPLKMAPASLAQCASYGTEVILQIQVFITVPNTTKENMVEGTGKKRAKRIM
jgi:hypothetical protein